jgi:hypothetical protein
MPVVIPKPEPPPEPARQPAPAAPAAPQHAGLTRAEVESMLAERDAAWERRLMALALTLAPQPEPPAPRKGARATLLKNTKGEITGFDIVPKE